MQVHRWVVFNCSGLSNLCKLVSANWTHTWLTKRIHILGCTGPNIPISFVEPSHVSSLRLEDSDRHPR